MTFKPTTIFTAAAILAGLGTTTVALAQQAAPSSPPSQDNEMKGQGGMMNSGMMDGGMMSADQMRDMRRMVENCNGMMESMMKMPSPDGKTTPHPKG